MGFAEACQEAEVAAVQDTCAEDVQLPQRWQLRQACKEQPAIGKVNCLQQAAEQEEIASRP